MLRHLVTAALAGGLLAASMASPANAAVPKTKPGLTVACGKKTAQLWMTDRRVAAKNSCSKWLIIQHWSASQSDPGPQQMSVAPGAHFNISLAWNDPGEATRMHLGDRAEVCAVDGAVFLKNSHGKATYC